MGSVSVGKLVGSMIGFCDHILTNEVLDLAPGQHIRVKFSAADKSLVTRTDRFKVVAGWYTWLCIDMACAMLAKATGFEILTEKFDLDLIKTYRYPNNTVEANLVQIVNDRWTIDSKLLLPSGEVLATARVRAKVFLSEEKND